MSRATVLEDSLQDAVLDQAPQEKREAAIAEVHPVRMESTGDRFDHREVIKPAPSGVVGARAEKPAPAVKFDSNIGLKTDHNESFDVKPAAATKQPVATDDDMPEELKGKSPSQLAKMYKEAQRQIGVNGAALGAQRMQADALIKAAAARAAPPAQAKQGANAVTDDVSFFANPAEAIQKAVSEHPTVKALAEHERQAVVTKEVARRETAAKTLNAQHSDADAILADESFRKWVLASPVRTQLLRDAHERHDPVKANEIIGTFKEIRAARAAEAVKATQAARPGGKPGGAAPKGGEKLPIYRRADLMELRINDPDRYEALGPQIEAAYRDRRVR